MPLRGPVPVKLFRKEESEKLTVGPMTITVFEDGSLTENRVSAVLLEVPAGKSGPPMHWHRFHDELFFITKGKMTFVTPDGELEAKAGDLMTVPPGAVHTFKNASETEDCACYMTATPGHYVDYFRMLAKATEEGRQLTSSDTQHLMALFGTFPPEVESEP
ncbi:RmlC-like cupin domain-containing protein [Cercophora newfieldiana]|uniref:RmlC-like cupin domain-containing protein n=1 Tax=Cercophora newfieldiana TaxID=92897 RepID=A0AA40CKL5_9PEZI|nr:RmlC-like cupin domain-containing protein [Cercophora newfieldiana]